MFKLIGKAFLLLASLAFLTAASLFIVGSYALTWPILRLSPRGQKKQAVANVVVAMFALAQAFGPTPDDDDSAQ